MQKLSSYGKIRIYKKNKGKCKEYTKMKKPASVEAVRERERERESYILVK